MSSIYDKSSLVLIPSGTKSGKVFSQKPVNGDGDFTFSRSTAATRVNAEGNIEKETQNLLDYSNTLSNSAWIKASITPTSGQSGYDGSSDAWLLDKTNTGGAIINQVSATGVNTASVYAKAGTLDFLLLYINYNSGTDTQAYFDLSSGLTGTTIAAIDSNITSLGGGWYRCDVSFNCPSTLFDIRFFPSIADNNSGGTGTIYIQDAQLEKGLVARDYIETTTAAVEGGITDNVPRLDYTDSSCPALLLEPQRTNINTHSEYFLHSQAIYTNASGTANAATSPEGVQNAHKLLEDTANARHRFYITGASAGTGNIVVSVFLKDGNRGYGALHLDTGTDGRYTIIVDLSDGSIVDTMTFGTPDVVDEGVEPYGDGWYRAYIVLNKTSSANVYPQIGLASSDNDTNSSGMPAYQGDGTHYIYCYGLQLEAGSYATSYIPTYGTSVTRNHEGTFSIGSMQSKGLVSGAFSFMVDFKDIARGGSSGNFIYCYTSIGGTMFYVYAGSIGVHTPTGEQYLTFPEADGKFALVYDGTSVKFFKNGAKYGSTYTASTRWADMDDFRLYLSGSTAKINYNETLFFNTALTDQEAIDLTTI